MSESSLKYRGGLKCESKRPPLLFLGGAKNYWSKLHAKRHLNLSRAANGLVDVAQSEGAIVKAAGLVGGPAGGRQRCGPLRRKSVVVLILVDVVERDVKAGSIGHIENIEAKLQGRTLR